MDPLIPFTRSTPSLTSGTSDTVSIPMTDDSGLGTLRPRSPALIELSDDGNPEPVRRPLAFASGAGVTPAEKLRSLLRQMESDVREPSKPAPVPRRPATPRLIDHPIPSNNSNSNADDEDDSEGSPPTPPPRISNPYYTRDGPELEPEAGPSRPRRLPSRAVALHAAVDKLPEQETAPNAPSALENFIARHHDPPESWKPKHAPVVVDQSNSRNERDSGAAGRHLASATPRRRHTPRRTTIEAPPDNSMAFAAGIQDPSIDIDDDSSMPAPWEDESSDLPDRSRGSGGRRSDRSLNSGPRRDDLNGRHESDGSVDDSPQRPKNRFQTRRFIKADLSDELPEPPEPPRWSQRSTRSASPVESESQTVRPERRWMQRGTRSPTGSFATAPQISPQATFDTSLPQVPVESSDEDTSVKRNRANMFRPTSESPKSRPSESPKSRSRDASLRTGSSGAYVDATSRSRAWTSHVSRSQPSQTHDDEVDESLDEPEPPWTRRSRRIEHEIDEADDEPEPPRRRRASHSREDFKAEADDPNRLRRSRSRELDVEEHNAELPRQLRSSRSHEVVQIDEEETVERSIDEGHVRVSRHRDMTTRYNDGSTEERHLSSQSVYEPLRWSRSEQSIEGPTADRTPEDSRSSGMTSRNRYDTADESQPSAQLSRSRYGTPDEAQSSVQHTRSRYGTPDETQPSLERSRTRHDKPAERSLKHSRSESQVTTRHSRSRYDTSEPALKHSRSHEDLVEDDSRTSLHQNQLRGFSFPSRKRTRSDEASEAVPPTPSPPKPLVSSHLRPQHSSANLSTPVRPGTMRASALRKSGRATPTPNRVRWSSNVEDTSHVEPPQSGFHIHIPRSTTPPPSTSPPTSPPRTPAPPAPSEPQSPLQPLATPMRGDTSAVCTPHPPGWLPDSPAQTPAKGGFSTPAPAPQTEPGSAIRTPHPPGWFNPTTGPSTPGAKLFSTPAPKEKPGPEGTKPRGVGVGAGFSTPIQPQQPFLATPKPPGAWGWTPAAGSRLRNEITLDSSQSSVESDASRTFERSLLGSGDVHRLKLSPRKSPKSSPSTSPKTPSHPLTVSTGVGVKENGLTEEQADDTPATPVMGTLSRGEEARTPRSVRLSQSATADESFMDDSFLQADTSVMARVRSFLSPSKDAELAQARERLKEAAAQSQVSRREIADAQQAWLAALAALPPPSSAAQASTTALAAPVASGTRVRRKDAAPEKGRRAGWPAAYWAAVALVEVLVMWAVFRLTVDWVDAERARTSSALVRRLPSGLGVFRKVPRSSNLFDVLELLGLTWAPAERRWNVPT